MMWSAALVAGICSCRYLTYSSLAMEGDVSDKLLYMVVAFSPLARILRECSTIHSPPALKKKKKNYVVICSRTLISLFRPESGSASWDDCGRVFPVKLPT